MTDRISRTPSSPSGKALRLFAAGLTLAVAGGVGLTAFAQPVPGSGPDHGAHHRGMHGGPGGGEWMMGRGLDRMLDSVKATDAQRTEIRRIADAARNDLRQQHEAGRALRQQAMDLFTQPTVDANAAESLRQQMLQQHDASSRRMLQAMLDVSRVLSPEQRQQLAAQMKQRMERMQRHRQAQGQPGAMPPPPTR